MGLYFVQDWVYTGFHYNSSEFTENILDKRPLHIATNI